VVFIDLFGYNNHFILTWEKLVHLYVKKPECPARKSEEDWPKWGLGA